MLSGTTITPWRDHSHVFRFGATIYHADSSPISGRFNFALYAGGVSEFRPTMLLQFLTPTDPGALLASGSTTSFSPGGSTPNFYNHSVSSSPVAVTPNQQYFIALLGGPLVDGGSSASVYVCGLFFLACMFDPHLGQVYSRLRAPDCGLPGRQILLSPTRYGFPASSIHL